MRRYVNQYRNKAWMYTVYGVEGGDDYILVAAVPGVGMFDIAMRLTDKEVDVLRSSEDAFTDFVNQFVCGRDRPQYKQRRIEQRISNISLDEIALAEGPLAE